MSGPVTVEGAVPTPGAEGSRPACVELLDGRGGADTPLLGAEVSLSGTADVPLDPDSEHAVVAAPR